MTLKRSRHIFSTIHIILCSTSFRPLRFGLIFFYWSRLRSLTFADGDTIHGHILEDHVSIGSLEATTGRSDVADGQTILFLRS